MDLAGVDAGEKMFVGLRTGGVAPSTALTCQMTDSKTKRGPRTNELVDRKACIRQSLFL